MTPTAAWALISTRSAWSGRWPAPALRFVNGKEVLVIEGASSSQFRDFYDWPGDKPKKLVGKYHAAGEPLIPWVGELSPRMLVLVAERLDRFFPW